MVGGLESSQGIGLGFPYYDVSGDGPRKVVTKSTVPKEKINVPKTNLITKGVSALLGLLRPRRR